MRAVEEDQHRRAVCSLRDHHTRLHGASNSLASKGTFIGQLPVKVACAPWSRASNLFRRLFETVSHEAGFELTKCRARGVSHYTPFLCFFWKSEHLFHDC